MSLIKLLQIPAKIFKKDIITFLIIRRHDLGDYCEEILVLKTEQNEEIALTYFRKGNYPEHPFILEVWPPVKKETSSKLQILTLGTKRSLISEPKSIALDNGKGEPQYYRDLDNQSISKSSRFDSISYKKSELSCKMSTSTLFFKIHGKKSRDNFAHLLLKIQNDLTTLSSKLSNLEQRIPTCVE